ncbi:MAG: hypothetical protein AAF442_04700 [Pseudomonadota bacterium]
MSREIDDLVNKFEKKMIETEKKIAPAKKKLDGYKLAYNTLAKSLSTIKKLPD